MPITTVRYSAEFSVNGLKRWISCESSVLKEGDEDKEIDAAIAFCFKTNDRVHGWQQPMQSSEPAILPTTIVEREIAQKEVNYADVIAKCQTIEELATWKLVIPADLKPAYMVKLKSLTPNIYLNGK